MIVRDKSNVFKLLFAWKGTILPKVKQTFNQPLLIYNICCALYALINSLFLIYRNKVFYYN